MTVRSLGPRPEAPVLTEDSDTAILPTKEMAVSPVPPPASWSSAPKPANPVQAQLVLLCRADIDSSVLAWRIPGMGEPGGLPSMGWHRVRHD